MKYILYARKSTEEDDRQVLSIEAQLVELQEYAAKEKLEIVASFCEAKTAKEPGRIKFIERGKADGIISWHPDRLARNSVDGGKIIHFVDRGLIKSLKFPTFWFEATPQGLFMLNIAFGQSKYFVDNLRENVKRGLRQKIRNGTWPGWAPVGYLNNAKTRGIDVDSEKAPKVKKLFEMYATGAYTLHSLANWCKEKGLRGNLGKEIALSNVQSILQNIFYIGLMKYGGEIHEGQHEPLISKKLFDSCREVMSKRGKFHYVRKNDFAFLGLMKCASCGCSITAEKQKGHHYYRCTRKKGPCQEKHYLREEILTEQITSYLQKVSLSSQDTEKVLAALDREQDKARESAQSEVIVLKEQLSQVEAKLQKLLDIYLADALSTEEYAAKKQSLLSQKVSLSEKITDFETKGLSWLEPAREFVKSLNQAANLLSSPNPIAMTTFLKNIGSNHILRNREFVFTPKIEYELVAERSEANQNSLTFPVWCTLQDSNLRPTRCKRVALPTELSVQDIFLYPVPTCTSFKEFFPPHRITSLIIRLTVNQCPWTMF
ncbi:MAG: Recombinase [Parcubacteria group bacterium GW2011_GWF2_52_12]|nr:MAG: Recombinase [Parcubacteria group bacterium GW2011_GWF2_52_12]